MRRPPRQLAQRTSESGYKLISSARAYFDSARALRDERTNTDLALVYEAQEIALWKVMFAYELFRDRLINFIPRDKDVPVVTAATTIDDFSSAATKFRLIDIGRNALRSAVWAAQATPVMSQADADFVERVTKHFAHVQKARNDLICANLLLPLTYVKSRRDREEFMHDLLQEANLGLIRSVDSFDPSKGKFSTYAVWWIRVFVQRAMTPHTPLDIPHRMMDRLTSLHVRLPRYHAMYGRLPLAEEITADLGISLQDARDLLDQYVILNVKRADGPLKPKLKPDLDRISDGLPDPEYHAVEDDMVRKVSHVFDSVLNDREAHVLRLRYGIGTDRELTLAEIGSLIGVTRERVRQIEEKATKKLQSAFDEDS